MNGENDKRRLGNKGNTLVAGVTGMEGAPDLLDSFNFFSLSACCANKFCHQR